MNPDEIEQIVNSFIELMKSKPDHALYVTRDPLESTLFHLCEGKNEAHGPKVGFVRVDSETGLIVQAAIRYGNWS